MSSSGFARPQSSKETAQPVADAVLRIALPGQVDHAGSPPVRRHQAGSDTPALERERRIADDGRDLRPGLIGPKSANLGHTASRVSCEERARRTGHPGRVVWFTGLPASGKSTIAVALERRLFEEGRLTYLLDGDNLRRGLCADLGFSDEDRAENVRRVGEVAKLLSDAGLTVLVALISPRRADRDRIRSMLRRDEFIEVHTDCPLAVCEARDPKGLYRAAREGRIGEFTGVDAPYEAPLAAEVVLRTGEEAVGDCVAAVARAVSARECAAPLSSMHET